MKKISLAVLALLVGLTTVFSAMPAQARSDGRVEVHNQSDAWVWITAYDKYGVGIEAKKLRILGTMCVAPGATDVVYMNGDLHDVRGEVTQRNCAHPVMLDRTLSWDGKTPYYVTGKKGSYKFWHTP